LFYVERKGKEEEGMGEGKGEGGVVLLVITFNIIDGFPDRN
jgi:hypothetical protein